MISISQILDKANRRFEKTQPPARHIESTWMRWLQNSEEKRQSVVLNFRLQKFFGSLAIQGREVGQGEKILYGVHINQCENR